MESRQYYLRKLKEQGVMLVNWKACTENSSELYTKNSARKEFEIMQGHMLVMMLTWYINSFPWYCYKGRVTEVTFFINKHCCDTPRYDVCYIQLMSKTCGYDLINKAEKPKNGEIQVMDQKGLLVIMSAVMKLSEYC